MDGFNGSYLNFLPFVYLTLIKSVDGRYRERKGKEGKERVEKRERERREQQVDEVRVDEKK